MKELEGEGDVSDEEGADAEVCNHSSWSVLELLTKLLDSSHSWFTGGLLRGMWASQGSVQGLSTSSTSFCEVHLNFSLQEDTGRELHHYLSHGFNILKVILVRYVSSTGVRQREVIVLLPGVRHFETWRQPIPHLQHLQLSLPKVWPPDEVYSWSSRHYWPSQSYW